MYVPRQNTPTIYQLSDHITEASDIQMNTYKTPTKGPFTKYAA